MLIIGVKIWVILMAIGIGLIILTHEEDNNDLL